MEYYKQVIRDTLDEIVNDGEETREDVLKRWEDDYTPNEYRAELEKLMERFMSFYEGCK